MNENKPIISLFDKDFKIDIDDNIVLNTNDIDSYIEDVKNNFFNIKHDISNFENFIDNNNNHILKSVLRSSQEVEPSDGCAGLFYNVGIPPTKDVLKTFNFNFSKTIPINISASIPEINIYDIPPGLKLLDVVPVVNGCDFLDTDSQILFPGFPCAVPEITFCEKKITKKILGKRITLGVFPYPCGLKQKMIGSIKLVPDDTESSPIYTFPKTGIQLKGSIYINTKITVEISTNVDVDFLCDTIKKFDNIIYNLATDNGVISFKDTVSVLKKVLSLVKNGGLEWLLKLVRFVYTLSSYGLTFAVTITSILVSYKVSINYFKAYHGDKIIEINNLSYEEQDFEILKNEKYIALKLESNLDLSLDIKLGVYQAGDMTYGCNLTTLLSKAITSELNNLNKLNVISSKTAARINQLNKIFVILTTNPISYFVLNNINIPIDLSIKLCAPLKGTILPEVVGCAKVSIVLEDVLKFIKKDLLNIIQSFLSVTQYLDEINVDNLQNIISVIPGAKIPHDIRNKINSINQKIKSANNLYLGFIQLALNAAFSVLDKIPSSSFPLTTTIAICVPII